MAWRSSQPVSEYRLNSDYFYRSGNSEKSINYTSNLWDHVHVTSSGTNLGLSVYFLSFLSKASLMDSFSISRRRLVMEGSPSRVFMEAQSCLKVKRDLVTYCIHTKAQDPTLFCSRLINEKIKCNFLSAESFLQP